MGAMELEEKTVQIRDDFDPDKILESGQCFRPRKQAEGWYRFVSGRQLLYLRPLRSGTYTVRCEPGAWETFWHGYFDLGRSYAALRGKLDSRDDFLQRAMEYGRGIRVLRQDEWEMLVSFIISQRKSIPAIRRAVELLSERFGAEPEKKVLLGEAPLYLPSVDFNALFLLRHTAGHFAAEKIGLRHLIDWTMFIDRHSEEIDWTALKLIVYKMNMHRFLRTLCALSIDYLGLDESKIPPFERDAQLEERVMNELLHPEFSEKVPKGNIFTIVRFKFRRWWANRWKHRIVYRENLLSSFFRSSWSHLLKPKSIK